MEFNNQIEQKNVFLISYTLDYRIVVGLRLFINQIFFENVNEKNKNAQIDVKMY